MTTFHLFTGEASFTLFYIQCAKWQEWRPLDPNNKLFYEYLIRTQIGSSRTFPIFYGYTMITEPTVFPVGDVNQNFTLEVQVNIIDSVGDPKIFVIQVQVREPIFLVISHA